MSEVILALGPVIFQDFEIPSGLHFGGRQILAVHQLTGGRRVVDSIGPDESEISFSGAFSGPDATLRARVLNNLRVTGSQLSLTWDIFFYTVVLREFAACYENPIWIPYRVSCTVVQDEAGSVASLPVSLVNSILSDLEAASAQCASFGVDLGYTQVTLSNPNATNLGSAAYMAARSSIATSQSTIHTAINATEVSLLAATSSISNFPGSLLTVLATSTLAAQELASLVSANAYLGRAARNLTNASS